MESVSGGRRFIQLLVLCTAILCYAGTTQAQRSQKSTSERSLTFEERVSESRKNVLGVLDQGTRASTPQSASLAQDAPIDPDTYVLGPGDVLGINLYGGVGMFYTATVTPEGTLVVPQLPMIDIGGLTLTAARDTISAHWSGELDNIPLEASLLQMRQMRVSVGGAVNVPGQYVVTPADRALTVIDLAGGVTDNASERRATLIHADGSRENVDRLRFLRFGAKDANPLLTAGDHLMVEPVVKVDVAAYIEVGGGVSIPGTYEWVRGDRAIHAIELGGGVRESAAVDSVRITHFVSGQPETRAYTYGQVQATGGPELNPGDLVYLQLAATWQPSRATVLVKGEVKRPGRYPIVDGETTLLQIIDQAGGFTERASLRGSRVWRLQNDDFALSREVERLDTIDVTLLSRSDQYLLRDYKRLLNRDFVPVDFVDLFEGGKKDREQNNIVLYDSLVVNVPREVHYVLVLGAVESPGYYQYEPGWEYKDYINGAGGYLKEGDERNTRHLPYESSQFMLARNDSDVNSGDVLYVPEKYIPPFWTTFRDYFSVFLQAATLAILIYANTQ